MPTVWVPALLRDLTAGQESVHVAGVTLLEVIEALEKRHPGLKERLCAGSDIRPGIAVIIDGQVNRAGLSAELKEDSEVHFIPAIGGGR